MLASDNPLEVIAEQEQQIANLKYDLETAVGLIRGIEREDEFTPIRAAAVQLFLRKMSTVGLENV